MSSCSTLVAALTATERLLTTVDEHVRLEALSLYAGKAALVTGEGLWSIVR